MLKRIALRLLRLAYGATKDYDVTVWSPKQRDEHDEALKREWLDKGFERGQMSKRVASPFNLYLVSTRASDPSQRDTQSGALGASSPSAADYTWWATVDAATGQEVALGQLSRLSLSGAIAAYLELIYLRNGAAILIDLGTSIFAEKRCKVCNTVIAENVPRVTIINADCVIKAVEVVEHFPDPVTKQCMTESSQFFQSQKEI